MTEPGQRAPIAVLFDLDGTLVDTKRLYLECYRRAVEPCLSRRLGDEEILALRPRSERRFLAGLVPPPRLEACMEDFYSHYHELHESHFGGIYPGVREMVDRLRGQSHRLGIVTGKSRRAWQITEPLAALGPVDVLVLDDEVGASKPDPEGIRIALERLGTPAARAVYVGDNMSDVRAARAAGVQPIAAIWGRRADAADFASRARAEGALPVGRPADIPDLVGRLRAHRLRA